jgi:hypothetical protein
MPSNAKGKFKLSERQAADYQRCLEALAGQSAGLLDELTPNELVVTRHTEREIKLSQRVSADYQRWVEALARQRERQVDEPSPEDCISPKGEVAWWEERLD